MNREIRFRAWDGESIIPFYSIIFLVEFDGTVWKNELDGHDNDHLTQVGIALMQYTGLKDKNGKEIYEGDILKTRICRHGVPTKDGKSIEVFGCDGLDVEWDEYRLAEFKTISNSTSFSLPKEDGTYQGRGKILEWEIVGNMYENPELLKEIEKQKS